MRDMMKLTVLIAQLFLIKFLIFLSVSYRSYDLGKSDFFLSSFVDVAALAISA